MPKRRTVSRYGLPVLLLFAALLLASTPGMAATEDDPKGSGQESEQQPAEPAAAETPAEQTAPPATAAAPTLNVARPLTLDTIADKAARYPDYPYILNEYGNQLLHRGRLVESESVYEKAVKLSPNFVQAWNNLGLSYQAQRKFGKAKRAYKKALDLAPNFAIVHYNLGTAYQASGNYNKMIASYQRALELDRRLSLPAFNPQVGANQHLSAVLLQIYTDRGGSAYYPVLSAYPDGK